jgi:hypothetical protein
MLIFQLAFQMRMTSIGNDMKLYGWLKDLTAYSSNFAELRDSNNSGSKIKYRVCLNNGKFFFILIFLKILQPAKADIVIIMDNTQQRIDVRISDIIVSIAPAAVKTLIGVTSSLGTLQVEYN